MSKLNITAISLRVIFYRDGLTSDRKWNAGNVHNKKQVGNSCVGQNLNVIRLMENEFPSRILMMMVMAMMVMGATGIGSTANSFSIESR